MGPGLLSAGPASSQSGDHDAFGEHIQEMVKRTKAVQT
jgi:hypothetical protein